MHGSDLDFRASIRHLSLKEHCLMTVTRIFSSLRWCNLNSRLQPILPLRPIECCPWWRGFHLEGLTQRALLRYLVDREV